MLMRCWRRRRRWRLPEPTVAARARDILLTPGPRAKVMAARRLARDWRSGVVAHVFDVAMPARPLRGDRPELLPPGRMPRRRKAGSPASRIALLHALAHIEYGAIDLAIDMAGRFGGGMPRAFVDDWLRVAAEEAMHFAILDRRLRTLGSAYGALPAHDGLWDAAIETSHDPLARLAIVPLVLEARGLDITPPMIERLRTAGDAASARLLQRIYTDEIRHVSAGARWFKDLCGSRRLEPGDTWRTLVARHFSTGLKPPFNDSAREAAGLPRIYYASVVPSVPMRKG